MRNFLAIASFTLLAGCALDRGELGFEPQLLVDAALPDAGLPQGDVAFGAGSGAGTMTGTWLLVHEASTCVVVDEQVTWASYLIEIEESGRTLIEHRTHCEISLSPVFGLEVVIPEAILPLIEFVEVDHGFVSGLRETGTYTSSTEVSLWGIELDDPLHDPVPSEPDDPAVIDADGDQNPGLTFEVLGSDCQRFIAQRTINRYFGTFTTPNQIDGSSVNVTDANVLGSSQPLCGVNPRLTPNDRFSRFRMVRVDGAGESIDLDTDGDGVITCDEVRPYFGTILERREASAENCN